MMTNQSHPTLIIASVLHSFQMILLIVIPQKAKHATKTAQAQNSDKEMMNALSKNTHLFGKNNTSMPTLHTAHIFFLKNLTTKK